MKTQIKKGTKVVGKQSLCKQHFLEVDCLLERKMTPDGLFYRVKEVGEAYQDCVLMPADAIPLQKRFEFELKGEREGSIRVYRSDQLKIAINTRHKVENHFVNGDRVVQIIKRIPIKMNAIISYLVKWNNREVTTIEEAYLRKYHSDLLCNFLMREQINSQRKNSRN